MKTGLWNACGSRLLVQGTCSFEDPASRDLSAGDAVSAVCMMMRVLKKNTHLDSCKPDYQQIGIGRRLVSDKIYESLVLDSQRQKFGN